jgi:flagellar protein FlaG
MANENLTSVALDSRAVQGSRTPDKVDVKLANGKPLPPAGTPAPQPSQVDAPRIDMSRAIASITAFLQENQRGLRFQVDKDSGRTIITVINPVSGEIVRQIPSQEVLDIARELKVSGALVNTRA